jgi:hypothetical protein
MGTIVRPIDQFSPLKISSEEPIVNFDEAIKAHTYWKVMLKWLINGQRPLDVSTVSLDSVCELGKWIAKEGRRMPGRQFLMRLFGNIRHFTKPLAPWRAWLNQAIVRRRMP